MKSLIALSFLIIFGWLAVVTFCGPELYRAINGPEPVKAAKAVTRHHRAK
jgi:ABC-type microcin C transport system permease subunit YejE